MADGRASGTFAFHTPGTRQRALQKVSSAVGFDLDRLKHPKAGKKETETRERERMRLLED